MLRLKQSILLSMVTLALLPLGSCANSPWASQLENALAADPQLQATVPEPSPEASPEASPSLSAELPANFPAEIPRYPNAKLISVTAADQIEGASLGSSQLVQTRWQTADSVAQVRQFYQEKLQAAGWQIAPQPTASESASPQPISEPVPPLRATKDGLEVIIAVQQQANQADQTEFQTELSLDYKLGNVVATSPGAGGFIGPMPQVSSSPSGSPSSSPSVNPSGNPASTSAKFSDFNKAPAELQPYLTDLAQLGLFTQTGTQSGSPSEFKPNAEISRREYVRWLVEANNLIYSNQPARKVRLAAATDKAAFQDISSADPDFGAIQGLANAGVIPSPLSGDSTNVLFRPDAPLTREEMILWKVPMDLRQALPSTSIDTIQQTWGFQDTTKIDPKAMRAVLADYQNGDLSNIRRAFGYTTLFQPKKSVSRAEAASVLWQFGSQGNSLNAKDALQVKSTP